MEILKIPDALKSRGYSSWPKVVLLDRREQAPIGLPYLYASSLDSALIFRLLVPILQTVYPYFNWRTVYYELTDRKYYPVKLYVQNETADCEDGISRSYEKSTVSVEEASLFELASDIGSYVNMDVLMEMRMIPAFLFDVHQAIKTNVTNNFAWTDGYNKKTKICSGYLTEQKQKKNLVILDISHSIPEGVSAGLLTLLQTITDITHADLIVTGGQSFFYSNEEAKGIDIHELRRRIPRANESKMFWSILKKLDLDYENVITFGDSDRPNPIKLDKPVTVRNWYSFFVSEHDRYGNNYKYGCGYGRWIRENCPTVNIIHKTDWCKVFK